MLEDLRRIARISVCCRVVVRDRYGIWTAITDDLCERGCQLVTQRLLRPGSTLHLTISSDLFPEELDVLGRTVWSGPDRLGVLFEGPGDRSALSSRQFLDKVLEQGAMPESVATRRLVPSVQRRAGGARPAISTTARNGRLVRTLQTEGEPLRTVRRASPT